MSPVTFDTFSLPTTGGGPSSIFGTARQIFANASGTGTVLTAPQNLDSLADMRLRSLILDSTGDKAIIATVHGVSDAMTVRGGYLHVIDAEVNSGDLRIGAISGNPGLFASNVGLEFVLDTGAGSPGLRTNFMVVNTYIFAGGFTNGIRLAGGNDPDNTLFMSQNNTDIGIVTQGTGRVRLRNQFVDQLNVDHSDTDNDTAILLRYKPGAGATVLQRVTVGAVDSGGAGFRVLRVPN